MTRLPLPVLTVILACAARSWCVEAPADPVIALRTAWVRLSLEEEKECRGLFAKLADDDFDVRESAMHRLLLRGPAVLPLIEEQSASQDQSVAAAAAELRLRLFTKYDGWWPLDDKLRIKLARRLENGWPEVGAGVDRPLAPLEDFAARQGIALQLDPRAPMGLVAIGAPDRTSQMPTVEEILSWLAQGARMDVLPRGDRILVSSSDTIEKLSRQRYVFDWKEFDLTGDEARRVTEGLEPFFPSVSTELHGSTDALSVRGVAGCIERAARIIALLGKDAPSAVWPPPDPGLSFGSVVDELSKPVDTILNTSEPLLAFQAWKKQGLTVGLWCEGKVYEEAPYPLAVRALSPLSLRLSKIPMGLTLRWYADRTRFAAAEQSHLALWPEVGDAGQIRLRVGQKRRDVLDLSVGGCDVSALSWGEESGAQTDKAIEQRIREKLRTHLELFPGVDLNRDIRVRRGRLLMQGAPSALAYAIELLGQWKQDGRPPVCPWYDRVDRSLDKKVDWDGRGLTAGSLVKRLRSLGEFPILLVDSPQGEPPYFKLTGEQTELLAPGQHSLRELLDELAVRANAHWEIRWGVVVLYAAPPKKKSPAEAPKAATDQPTPEAKPEKPAAP
jgi:hypothetical protein